MMPRYKLTIEYNGTNFIGWQKQKKGFSIQGTIEKAAKNFLQNEVDLTVAGRTDAGVHAEAQVAHLDIFKKLEKLEFIPSHFISLAIKSMNKKSTNSFHIWQLINLYIFFEHIKNLKKYK